MVRMVKHTLIPIVLLSALIVSLAFNTYVLLQPPTVIGIVDHKSVGEGVDKAGQPITWYAVSLHLKMEDKVNGFSTGETIAYSVDKGDFERVEGGDVVKARLLQGLRIDVLEVFRRSVSSIGPILPWWVRTSFVLDSAQGFTKVGGDLDTPHFFLSRGSTGQINIRFYEDFGPESLSIIPMLEGVPPAFDLWCLGWGRRTLPNGITYAFDSSLLGLDPGGEATATLRIAAAPDASLGTYKLTLHVYQAAPDGKTVGNGLSILLTVEG